MTQKKLIEAFKAFVQKSVLPLNTTNQVLINDWKHFNNIISGDPIDTKQLDFYLYVVNKQQTNSPTFNKVGPERQNANNISDFSKFGKRSNDYLTPAMTSTNVGQKTTNSQLGDKKNTNMTNSQGSRRKNLIENMQNFQNMLAKNQQKLENYNKTFSGVKDSAGYNNTSITSNGGTKKYY